MIPVPITFGGICMYSVDSVHNLYRMINSFVGCHSWQCRHSIVCSPHIVVPGCTWSLIMGNNVAASLWSTTSMYPRDGMWLASTMPKSTLVASMHAYSISLFSYCDLNSIIFQVHHDGGMSPFYIFPVSMMYLQPFFGKSRTSELFQHLYRYVANVFKIALLSPGICHKVLKCYI